jgi:hypothetical protein
MNVAVQFSAVGSVTVLMILFMDVPVLVTNSFIFAEMLVTPALATAGEAKKGSDW